MKTAARELQSKYGVTPGLAIIEAAVSRVADVGETMRRDSTEHLVREPTSRERPVRCPFVTNSFLLLLVRHLLLVAWHLFLIASCYYCARLCGRWEITTMDSSWISVAWSLMVLRSWMSTR